MDWKQVVGNHLRARQRANRGHDSAARFLHLSGVEAGEGE